MNNFPWFGQAQEERTMNASFAFTPTASDSNCNLSRNEMGGREGWVRVGRKDGALVRFSWS